MDQVEQFKGNSGVHSPNPSVSNSENKAMQIGLEDKKAAVNEEMKRMNKLPPNSVYVIHRARVLNKIMQLLSLQRTTSQDEELELLFAGLSL